MIGCGCGAQSPFTSVTSVTCSSGRQVGLVVVVLVRVHLQVLLVLPVLQEGK